MAITSLPAATIQAAANLINVEDAAENFEGDTVEEVLAEIGASTGGTVEGLATHIADPTDAHDASAISVVPAGAIASTNVQDALEEVDGAVTTISTSITTVSDGLDAHLADAVDAHDASAISFTPNGTIAATDVQTAIQEVRDEAAAGTGLSDHLADTVDAHDASAVSFAPAGSIAATDVQAALVEVDADVTAHVGDATAAHAASAISYGGGTGMSATDVEAAIDELATEKAVIGSTVALGGLGTTETIDASTATRFTGTLDNNVTITVTNLSSVFDVVLVELLESGGGHTITWSGAANTPLPHSDVNGDRSLFAVSFTADGPFVALVGTWTP
jgi:hypothetical protein